MDLIIIGKSNDDKGTQLEKLTHFLLGRIGVQEIVTNQIGAGGHEIDVYGKIIQEGLGERKKVSILCECKAKKDPINSTDWLKFLGKIHLERETKSNQINGYLIAFNGANGNVYGSYEEFRNHQDYIELISGETLTRSIRKVFSLATNQEILKLLSAYTDRIPKSLYSTFYDGNLFIIIIFEDGLFTLLKPNLEQINSSEVQNIIVLISNHFEGIQFIELETERIIKSKREILQKMVIALFLHSGLRMELKVLLEKIKEGIQENDNLFSFENEDSEINRVVDHLVLEEVMGLNGDEVSLRIGNNIEKLHFLKWIHSGRKIAPIFTGKFYDEVVNADFLNFLIKEVGKIQIPENEINTIFKLLKWSPEALQLTIRHCKDINSRVGKEFVEDSRSARNAFRMLKEIIVSGFLTDFQRSHLTEYFHETRNISEIKETRNLEIWGPDGIVECLNLMTRKGIGKMDTGGFASIWLLDDAPNPTERKNPGKAVLLKLDEEE
ncbi:MAG: hypothetical protein H6581_18945 [Bacteroidia bacterium]|nr:hypothetical protein [Bacteroidia bacterium]